MDRQKALRILGLSDNTSQEQIESKFSNLHRRIRNGEELDKTAIEEAYRFLAGKEKIETGKENKHAIAYRHFMFHYKSWALLIILSLTVVSILIVPMFFRRVPDLTISFVGRYGFVDDTILDTVLQENMPEVKDILVELMYMDSGASGEFDTGGRLRLSTLLMTEEADLFIADAEAFNFIRSDNSLLVLDDVITEISFDIDEARYIYGIDFETGEKKIFGILVNKNNLIYKSIYGANERIICIARETQHLEEVIKAIEIILTYGSGE